MSPATSWHVSTCHEVVGRVRFEPERTGTPFLFFFWSPERRSGPFRDIAAKFRFHLNESDKFALFGSKMPSASASVPWPGALPLDPAGGTAPDPHIGSRSRARHILSVPVLFLTGNEPWSSVTCYKYSITCQDDLLTVDNAQSHVTAFQPISEVARSWSDDNFLCVIVIHVVSPVI